MIGKPRLSLIAGPVAMLVLIGSAGWVLWSGLKRSKEASQSVEHTYHVLIASERFLSTIRELESTTRAYVITGNKNNLPPYQAALAAQTQITGDLGELTRDNPEQQAGLQTIRKLTAQRLAVLAQAQQEVTAGRNPAVSGMIPSGRGRKIMAELTARVRAFEDNERRLLVLRTNAASEAVSWTRFMLILTSSLLAVILLFAGAAVERYVRNREAAHEALQRQADLIEFSHDAIVTMNPHGVVTGWNEGAAEVYGWSSAEALGRQSREVLPANDARVLAAIEEALGKTGHWDGELAQTTKDGRTRVLESRYVQVRNRTGAPVGVLTISRDETQRKHAEELLAHVAEQRRLALDAAQLGSWDYNVEQDRVLWDERCREIMGLSGLGPATFEQVMRMVHPEEQKPMRTAANEAMSGHGDGRFSQEMRIVLRNGSVRWLATNGRVYFAAANGRQRPVRVIGVNSDITERKRVEEALRESEDKLRAALAESDRERRRLEAILGTMPAGVVLAGCDNELLEGNAEAVQIWRAGNFATLAGSLQKLRGWRADSGELLRLEDWPRARALRGETVLGDIIDIERFDGTKGTVFNAASPVRDARGAVQGAVGVMVDITEQRQIELALRRSEESLRLAHRDLERMLEQKNILFQEVQHRVKNNLQIVSSLLSLEAQRYQDSAFHNALNESRDRIRSMALMHEKFYHLDDLARIDFSEYVDELARYFFSSYIADPSAVGFSSNVDVKLGMGDAIPCGLILQELLSNSVKHAFPEGKGDIGIEFHAEGGKFRLCYRDSGVGLPLSVDLKNPASLGLQLVTDLTHQLQGKIMYEYRQGAQFTLTFG